MNTTSSVVSADVVSEDSTTTDLVAVAVVFAVHCAYSCYFYCCQRGTRPNDAMNEVRRAWIQQNRKSV